ncbi:MAG: PQQ-binding-like beta-propeller repeat protein, partial [Planctomycetaceae bacterium]|nr:PQQ-binding-like beta-propeller repeat protein [Planctomycetaceae bacterium]
ASSALAENWPRFRGENGVGHSDLQGVPTNWTKDDYEWVLELPGKGHSCPVVWGKQLFVTCGKEDGTRTTLCLDAITGKTIWQDSIQLEASHLHKKNSYASGTPCVDGERVYVTFGDDQHYTILAYSLSGERLWSKDLGAFTSQHGFGISPIVHNGKVILPDDQMGPSKVEALDVKTGNSVWSHERKFRRTSYATPLIAQVDGKDQIVCLSGAVGLAGLDPETGNEIWSSGEMPMRTVGSPVMVAGKLVATCGSGGRGKYLVAVEPAATSELGEHQERTQNLPYVPTPIANGNYLYLWCDDGIVCCVDMTQPDLTKNVWRERVGGNYSGSPVLINGKIYCISEEGEIAVIDASPTFKDYGKSPLGDQSYATPAVANGRVYFRGFNTLACLKAHGSALSE